MDTSSQEIIASAFAAAVSVVGLLKGFSYVSEKRGKENGETKYATFKDVHTLRSEWKDMCDERHKSLSDMRTELKVDTVAYRIGQDVKGTDLNVKIDKMQKEIKDELVKLGEKVDGLASIKKRI
jgi:uncharacterized protein YjaG (DUF416 family)